MKDVIKFSIIRRIYSRHINRKNPCKSCHVIKNKLPPKSTELPPKPTNILQNNHQNLSNLSESKQFKCNYCQNTFVRNDSLNRHLSGRCKVKKQQDNEKEDLLQKLVNEMAEMKAEIKKNNEEIRRKDDHVANLEMKLQKLESENKKYIQKIKNQQNNKITTQNNIDKQQNINVNFKLLAFGKEDMTNLADDVCKKILNKGFKSVPNLVEFVHFNKNKPENHNVYISNMQNNYVLVYDGEDWKLKERDNVLQQLIDNKTEILSDKFDELLNKLDEPTIRKFQRFLDQKDEDKIISNIKNDLKLLLYNNKKIPERTRELLSSNDDDIQMIEVNKN